jgi:predicted transcriptional regulator
MSRQTPSLLTALESEVMQALWSVGQADVHTVQERLGRPLAYNTVLSVLRILEEKGYVTHRPHPERPRAYLYEPAVLQTRAQRRHVRDLAERLFAGDVAALATGLLEDEHFTRDELERLRAAVDSRLENPSRRKGKKR